MFMPLWVLLIPGRSDPNYFHYLTVKAKNDGMPEHVRSRLIQDYKRDNQDHTPRALQEQQFQNFPGD